MKRLVKTILALVLSPLPVPRHPMIAGPGLHVRWRIGWLRGCLYRVLWRLKAVRFEAGARFSLQGQLKFGGPGRVVFGDDVIIGAGTLCTPFAHTPDSLIRIGSRTFVNGTRFGCERSIEIGDDCILADARIMDTDFHAVHKQRNRRGMAPAVKPIRIGNNVWIGAGSAVMKGVEIGDDSVIAFGAVVVSKVPAGKIFGGNPARELALVPEGPAPESAKP